MPNTSLPPVPRPAPVPEGAIWTFLDYFYHWEKTIPDHIYLRQPWQSRWDNYSWRQVGEEARRMAAALRAMDLPPQSRIGLISKNCPHWIICDLAIMMSGHICVPFYPNLSADQLRQVLEHSECKVLFAGKLDNLNAVLGGTPEGVRRIALPLAPPNTFESWQSLIETHAPMRENYHPPMDHISTIVYTSGTTGIPKGVVKTWYAHSSGIRPTTIISRLDRIEGRFFSYLPLNHDAERAVVEGGSLVNGGTIYFVESIDTFADNLRAAQPTIFLAVPRIWTKFQMGVLEKLPPKRLNTLLRIPGLSALIRRKIRQGLGLDKVQLAISGAAPIPKSTLEWFDRIGVNICEGYGMTENSAICTLNPADDRRIGTVGIPYPGCELRIDPATKEVLVRAEWLMAGYYKNEALSTEVLRQGWLHTGDMGELSPDGYLSITGRVKDMFKTSKGEYIIPVPIEHQLATDPLIEQVCVMGYGQAQPFAMVCLSEAARHHSEAALRQSLQGTLAAVNSRLVDYERIAKMVVVREGWSVENGVLTPTLKVKRDVLEQRYAERMARWYEEGGETVLFE